VPDDVEIGIFGGSGFYDFLDDVQELEVETPYGEPSAPVAIGAIDGRRVAFLPRHGRKHELPPHMINYRANAWALKDLGVARVIGPCAAGSLRWDVAPGHFVVCDQLVDRTNGRGDTFFDGPETTHVSWADPYCPQLRDIVVATASGQRLLVRDRGTVVTIQGPRFSTRAESKWYQDAGWDVINMTQYPEAYLARELQMCYVNISLITDYDVGVAGEIDAVSHEEVLRVFKDNNVKLRNLLFSLIPAIPRRRDCSCGTALEGARLEA
jgi:5'-methylthioadenosine phosphorylase